MSHEIPEYNAYIVGIRRIGEPKDSGAVKTTYASIRYLRSVQVDPEKLENLENLGKLESPVSPVSPEDRSESSVIPESPGSQEEVRWVRLGENVGPTKRQETGMLMKIGAWPVGALCGAGLYGFAENPSERVGVIGLSIAATALLSGIGRVVEGRRTPTPPAPNSPEPPNAL